MSDEEGYGKKRNTDFEYAGGSKMTADKAATIAKLETRFGKSLTLKDDSPAGQQAELGQKLIDLMKPAIPDETAAKKLATTLIKETQTDEMKGLNEQGQEKMVSLIVSQELSNFNKPSPGGSKFASGAMSKGIEQVVSTLLTGQLLHSLDASRPEPNKPQMPKTTMQTKNKGPGGR